MTSVAVEGGEGGLVRCHQVSGFILVQRARHSIVLSSLNFTINAFIYNFFLHYFPFYSKSLKVAYIEN
jgi:hypothetical protein